MRNVVSPPSALRLLPSRAHQPRAADWVARTFVRITACSVLLTGLCGFVVQEVPRGAFAPDHTDAPVWALFRTGAKFNVDNAKGVVTASFDDSLKKADGKPFTIEGYMLPLEPGTSFKHFAVTRRSSGCPFCPPNELGEAVEVFTTKPVRYTTTEVFVTGRFRLQPSSNQGMFYRIEEGKLS